MNPERWQRIKELFQSALVAEPGAARRAVLAAAGDDSELVSEVEGLLASHAQAGDFIEEPARLEAPIAPEGASLVGRTLGAYRVLGLLGHGGMGSVYLAERADDQYRQKVAVKLIKLGMDTAYLVGRFRQERQILADLEHPHIARLLDGGSLEDGRPYLVMEHIEGAPIDRWCAERELSLDQRLDLFRQVCEAVHFAHRNLVIHRDLKPGNILVTADGTPKLLDFGTAKLLAAEPGRSAPATATGVRLLTPDYASPEQLRGERVTTASDVYALGCVLYELLTGRRPYQLTEPLGPDDVRRVCEEDPPRPSAVVSGLEPAEAEPSARRISRRRLSGDLDNIVRMAMRKEPERRYASAAELAEDVRRFQQDHPVAARPDTLRYRVGKFVRRHRIGVMAAALILLALAAGVLVAGWQARKAVAERNWAEAAWELLADVLEESDPVRSLGEPITAQNLLARAADRLTEEEDDPQRKARVLEIVGRVQYRLDLYEDAERNLVTAVDLHQLAQPGGLGEASAQHKLGLVRLAQGDYRGADELLERALAIRRAGLDPPHEDIAQSLSALGHCRYERGEWAQALAFHEESLAMRSSLPEVDREKVAESLNNLGTVLRRLGRLDEAEARVSEALAIRRELFGTPHPWVARGLNNLAVLRLDRGDLDGAAQLFEESLAMERHLHPDGTHRSVATALDNLADMRRLQGQLDSALALQEESLALRRRLFGDSHSDVAFSLHNLGAVLADRGEFAEAVDRYRGACEMWEAVKHPEHEDARACRWNLGWTLHRQGEHRAAQRELELLLATQRRLLAADDLELARTLAALGIAHLDGGNIARGSECLEEALTIRRPRLAADDPRITGLEGRLAAAGR